MLGSLIFNVTTIFFSFFFFWLYTVAKVHLLNTLFVFTWVERLYICVYIHDTMRRDVASLLWVARKFVFNLGLVEPTFFTTTTTTILLFFLFLSLSFSFFFFFSYICLWFLKWALIISLVIYLYIYVNHYVAKREKSHWVTNNFIRTHFKKRFPPRRFLFVSLPPIVYRHECFIIRLTLCQYESWYIPGTYIYIYIYTQVTNRRNAFVTSQPFSHSIRQKIYHQKEKKNSLIPRSKK